MVFFRDVSAGFMFCRKPTMLLPYEGAVAAAISDYKRQPTLYPPAANEPCVFMRSAIRLPDSRGPQPRSSLIEFYTTPYDVTNSRMFSDRDKKKYIEENMQDPFIRTDIKGRLTESVSSFSFSSSSLFYLSDRNICRLKKLLARVRTWLHLEVKNRRC